MILQPYRVLPYYSSRRSGACCSKCNRKAFLAVRHLGHHHRCCCIYCPAKQHRTVNDAGYGSPLTGYTLTEFVSHLALYGSFE